jgi:hypothetical protein
MPEHMMSTGRPPTDHLSGEDLAAYLDGELEAAERSRIQSHLADCDSCREEVVELTALVHADTRHRRWTIAVPAAAVAAIAAVLLVSPLVQDGADAPGERVRGPELASEREAVLEVRALAPALEATVDRDSLRFSWEGLEPDATYRLTLTDQGGDPLWTHETSGTALLLPPDVELQPEGSYLWFVDALLADGRTATSGVLSFKTVR